jgi:hypothetical protein
LKLLEGVMNTVAVHCGCGSSFAVPLSYAGMMHRCPRCGVKCSVPEAPAAGSAPASAKPRKPVDPSAWDPNALPRGTASSGVLTILAPHGAYGVSIGCLGMLGLFGLLKRPAAYLNVWEFDRNRQRVALVRRRGLSETEDETFPFSSVIAVQLTNTGEDVSAYSVDLLLKSGRSVFISYEADDADAIATFLGVPKQQR